MASFLSGLSSAAIFVGVLSILILVHEWGHFITAKRLGVAVERFAIGFGPTLFSRKYNGTRYMINAIPLGGYVKMAGDERAQCKGKPDEFYSKSVGRRALIVLNGPVVNFILAYVSFVFVFMLGYPGQSTTITELMEGGPAQIAGLRAGDKIVALDGKGVYGWLNLERRLEGDQSGPVTVTIVREGERLTRTVNPRVENRPNLVGRLRWIRDLGVGNFPNVIGGLVERYPAEGAGLQGGDRIAAVDGRKVEGWSALKEAIAASTGKQIILTIVRDGQTIRKAVTPKIDMQEMEDGGKVPVRKIGIGPWQELDMYRFEPGRALVYAAEELGYITQLTYESLYRMVTGAMSARETVTGPVGIFYIVKGAADEGISHLLFILGVISASLAIFNLLPVIPLDGGHLFLFAVEKVRGKALSERVDEYVARAGLSLIVLLAVFVFYSDFARFGWLEQIGNWWGNVKSLFS